MHASSGGGSRRHSPHCVAPPAKGRAQRRQRGTGGAKRATQAAHNGAEGQLWQTAQLLASGTRQREKKEAAQVLRIGSIYWPPHA